MSTPFRVQQIDHVELFVPDQYEAAAWYERVFGLQILPDYEFWAANGPLMISSNGGGTMLALFRGEANTSSKRSGLWRVAFRVDGDGFLTFVNRLGDVDVYDSDGRRVQAGDVVDHDLSWSIYFNDPWGNRFEVTTYEYDAVREALAT